MCLQWRFLGAMVNLKMIVLKRSRRWTDLHTPRKADFKFLHEKTKVITRGKRHAQFIFKSDYTLTHESNAKTKKEGSEEMCFANEKSRILELCCPMIAISLTWLFKV